MVTLSDVMSLLEDVGFFAVILPFMLIFTITFAVLTKSNVLGKNKGVQSLVSFVFALLVVRNKPIVGFLNNLLPNVSVLMIIIILVLFLIGIFGSVTDSGWVKGLIAVVAILFMLWAVSSELLSKQGKKFLLGNVNLHLSDQTVVTIIFVAILVLVPIIIGASGSKSRQGEVKL